MENFGSWKMAWPNEKGPSDFACVIGDEKRACHAMWTKPPAKSGYGVSASMLTLGDINPLVLVNMIQHRVETRSQPCEPQNSSQMDILVQEVLIHSHRSGSQLAGSPFFSSENHCAGDQAHPVARSSGTSRRPPAASWVSGGAMCPSWKMMEFVNGKDDIPYMKWKIKNVWNQPVIYHWGYRL